MQETRSIEKELNLEATEAPEKGLSSSLKRIAIWGTLLVAAFLLGFIPSWVSERETVRQRDAAQANLRVSQMQNRLATAAMNARRGEYETARVATSDFFTDLRAEIDRQESGFNPRQRKAVQSILDERDGIITLLARSDEAAAERLTDLYLLYTEAVNPSATATP